MEISASLVNLVGIDVRRFCFFRQFCLALILTTNAAHADEPWRSSFSQIPLSTQSFHAYKTEPVQLILQHFQPTETIRAFVLMPGAADQLYFFDCGQITLPENPTLLDALTALTNRAHLILTASPPFLLLHTTQDQTTDPLTLGPKASLAKLDTRTLPGRTEFLDRPYDRILSKSEKATRLRFKPARSDSASWHYYRLSFVGYDLTATELLRAIAYGSKTSVQVERSKARFTDRPFTP